MSVSQTPNQALLRTLVMLNTGLRPSFNITQCSQQGLVWGMGHRYSVLSYLHGAVVVDGDGAAGHEELLGGAFLLVHGHNTGL